MNQLRADGARKKNTARHSSRGLRHYVPFRTRFLIAPTHTKQKKPNALWRGLLLFVIPFQNRSVPQVFSKLIRVFRSVDRIIPWR